MLTKPADEARFIALWQLSQRQFHARSSVSCNTYETTQLNEGLQYNMDAVQRVDMRPKYRKVAAIQA